MPMEVITTSDKEQRDRIFCDLRANGDANERQAVKFSGCRLTGFVNGKKAYESTWSVAYPNWPLAKEVPDAEVSGPERN